jgi:hypothetical protein
MIATGISVSGSEAMIVTLAGGGPYTPSGFVPRQGFMSSAFLLGGALSFSPDRSRLYVAQKAGDHGAANQVRFLDIESKIVDVFCAGLDAEVQALCCDRAGYVFVATGNKIFKFDFSSGERSFVVGGGPNGNDAAGESAGFINIKAMTFDGNDDLLVLDEHRVRKVAVLQRCEVTTLFGGRDAGHVDGYGESTRFNNPRGFCVASNSIIYVADMLNHRIRKVRKSRTDSSRWEVTTIAGDGQNRVVDGQGTAASIQFPADVICVDGWLYVVEEHTVRCVSPMGHVTTIAGNAPEAGYRDMAGSDARFNNDQSSKIATDGRGTLVLTDTKNQRLRSFQVHFESAVRIPPSTLEADLESLISNESASDLKITVQGRPLYTLRGLLTTRSTHFQTMLSSGFKESAESEITLSEESFEAVRAVLLYLHADKLEVDDEHAVEVLQLSERWDLPRLNSMAQEAITRRMTADNVCALFTSADELQAAELRETCLSFILHNFGPVQESGKFSSLEKALLCEVIQSIRM